MVLNVQMCCDIKKIQQQYKESQILTDGFLGSRVKRGLFIDEVVNKAINADVNGARNI